jgi:hypothetical protein
MKKILTFLFLSILLATPAVANGNEDVAFNTSTRKVHKLWCRAAQRCTVNCIIVKREKAYKRGGVPCKICGG